MKRLKEITHLELENNSVKVLLNVESASASLAGTVYLQISDDSELTSISLAGKLESIEEECSIGAISIADYKAVEEITEAGIYFLPADGLTHLKITATGSADVTLKIIED